MARRNDYLSLPPCLAIDAKTCPDWVTADIMGCSYHRAGHGGRPGVCVDTRRTEGGPCAFLKEAQTIRLNHRTDKE